MVAISDQTRRPRGKIISAWPWLSKDMKSWLSKFYPLNLLSASPLFSVLKMYISVLPCQRTEADRNRPHSASALQQPQMLIVVTDSFTK